MPKLALSVERFSTVLPFKCWLDSPKSDIFVAEGVDQLTIRGWAFSQEVVELIICVDGRKQMLPMNQTRPDVTKKIQQNEGEVEEIVCGFNYSIGLKFRTVRIGFLNLGKEYWIAKIDSNAAAGVICGVGGWLFLDNDTNRSVDQFQGKSLLPQPVLDGWQIYLDEVSKEAAQLNVMWKILVAPAKEEVFPDFYPHERGVITPIDQFLRKFSETNKVIFPLAALLESRDLTYYTVDTHWSDFGAYVAASEVLENYGLAELRSKLSTSYKIVSSQGDLGSKMLPPRTSGRLVATFENCSVKKVFDNGLLNTGKIWIYENVKAAVNETLIIFGDSFSLNMAKLLAKVFGRVVYTHTVAKWDQEIVLAERAKYVLLQTNQRFLVSVPQANINTWTLARAKLSKLTSDEANGLLKHLQSFGESESFYLEKMRRLLEECAVTQREMMGRV